MKHRHSFILASSCAAAVAIALLAFVAITTNAQTWENLVSVAGQSSKAIMVDPASLAGNWPDLVASAEILGLSDVNGTPYKIWRLSQADTVTPSNPDLAPLNASGSIVYSMTTDPTGKLYWAGTLNPLGSGNKWIMRRSGDGGSTWQELLRWELSAGAFARARSVTVDDAGRLFVAGMACDTAAYPHWVVLKSEDQGVSWVVADNFKANTAGFIFPGINAAEALGSAFVPGSSGGLYVVGARDNAWTVTRSRDGGATSLIVDSWVPKRGRKTHAIKVTQDGAGRIFVLGGVGGPDFSSWVVRMSDDNGLHWRTIFGPWNAASGFQRANDLTIDAHGNLWIAGVVYTSTTAKGKTTLTSIPTVVGLQETLTGTWNGSQNTVAPVSVGNNGYYDLGATAITADNLGYVYVSGSFKASDSSPWQWFVQRRLP